MAIEWYLMKPPHDQLSGYEDEAMSDFAQEGFEEINDSGFAYDVEICNYNLSIRRKTKAVVQNNVQDTRLKTLSRTVLLPIGSCKAGMYIKYEGRYWLITGLVDDNKMYEKAIVSLCNYLLTWSNDKGQIIQRWANITSASQYNNGETGVTFYYVGSDQLLILTPDDRECLLLNSGHRFIIDRRCEIYQNDLNDSVTKRFDLPVNTYKLTRSDSVLYSYGDSGHYEFMAYQDEQHDDDGYYVVDGKGYWLCDVSDGSGKREVEVLDDGDDKNISKPKSEESHTPLSSEILYDALEVYNGIDPSVFVAKFYDNNGDIDENVLPQWEIESDFAKELTVEYKDNAIYISVNDKKLINKSFNLTLKASGYESTTLKITIRAFM